MSERDEEAKRQAEMSDERIQQAALDAEKHASEVKAADEKARVKKLSAPLLPQATPPILFAPDPSDLPPPIPNATPQPEPMDFQKIRNNLPKELQDSVHYDASRGQLTFSGPKGLDALERSLEQFPGKFAIVVASKEALKESISEIMQRPSGADMLKNLGGIDIGGVRVQGEEMRALIQEVQQINDTAKQPRP